MKMIRKLNCEHETIVRYHLHPVKGYSSIPTDENAVLEHVDTVIAQDAELESIETGVSSMLQHSRQIHDQILFQNVRISIEIRVEKEIICLENGRRVVEFVRSSAFRA